MKSYYLSVLTVFVLFGALFAAPELNPPLCQNQKNGCECSRNDSRLIIHCNTPLANVIKNENFIKPDKTTFPIDELIFSHVHILSLDVVFPNSSLKVLDLSENNIFNISDGVFRNLQQMEKLILSKNNIDYINGEAFRGILTDGQDYPLISLKELRLNDNSLHSLHSDIFQHIDRHLERLFLGNNPFKVIDLPTLQAINSLVYLKELDLTNTGLYQLPANFFHTPLYLEKINLSFNSIESVKDLNLQEAHTLNTIDLSGNPIVNLTEETGFPNVSTIHTLHLCQMPLLEAVSPHSLSELSSLENLYLSDNPQLRHLYEEALISKDKNSEVPIVLKLKKLYIGNNQLMYLNFTLDWSLLDYVDIRGNRWSCDCNNERLLEVLFPMIKKEDLDQANHLVCGAPEQMEGKLFKDIYDAKIPMRCLDLDGNHPERDGTILVCILLGLLLGITFGLFCMYSYQRNWYGLLDTSPAAFSRSFYQKTRNNDNDLL